MTPGIFVTGTNTGVGKTLVAAALTHALAKEGYRVVGLKPVASGSAPDSTGHLRNPDALALQAASSVRLPYELVNPYCFEPGIAPHLAAEEAQQVIAVDDLVAWYGRATADADIAIVEGAGGWRVPLHPLGFLSDLPEQLGLRAVLVVGLTLGCLNHARLTLESIQHAGRAPFLGWIGNRVDPGFQRLEGNLHTLERLLGGPPLAIIPPLGPTADPAEVAEFFAGPLTQAAVAPLLRAVRPR
jgi:dethiobiotin synthetase